MGIQPPTRTNSGITLLEVLISIGILAIGLIGTLSLIPAGGSYLRKAQIEGRAAALIPNTFNTMKTSALFNENAIDWTVHDDSYKEKESALWGYPSYPAGVANETIDDSGIDTWFIRDDPPWISGTGAEPSSEITVTATGPGGVVHEFTAESEEDGSWHTALLAADLSVSDPPIASEECMTITEVLPAPDDIDIYFDDWRIRYEGSGEWSVQAPRAPSRESDSDALERLGPTEYRYRHYRRRRHRGWVGGEARLDFSLPSYNTNVHRTNDTLNKAELIEMESGYDENRRRILGSVWRYDRGYREGRYTRYKWYWNEIKDGPLQNFYGTSFTSPNAGSWWCNASGIAEDPTQVESATDCYNFAVLESQEFIVQWYDTDTVNYALSDRYLDDDDVDDLKENRPLEIYHNGALLPPTAILQSEPNFVRCVAPSDGSISLKVNLLGLIGDPNNPFNPHRVVPNAYRKNGEGTNPGNGTSLDYQFDLTVFGSTQVALIDPLMGAQIEYVIEKWSEMNNGAARTSHPLYPSLLKAAEFGQSTSVEGLQIPFTLRRMNWNIVSRQSSPTNMVSVASSLCRPADVLEVTMTDDELEAPEPRYDLQPLSKCCKAPVYIRYTDGWAYCDDCRRQTTVNEYPMRRQKDDRMSWMLSVQPENGGSIQANWQAGNYFDVALVVFNNRVLPPIGSTQIEGEHSFDSWWNEDTGTITLSISRSSGIDGDDIRKMFAAGNWVMVAPKRASRTQKIDWLQIQNAEFVRDASQTIVEIIPRTEPVTSTLPGVTVGSAAIGNDAANLVTLVYQGVVAVSRQSIQITE